CISLIAGSNDCQFVLRIQFTLEAIQQFQGAISGVTITASYWSRRPASPFDHDDLVGKRIYCGEVILDKRFPVENNHPKGGTDLRTGLTHVLLLSRIQIHSSQPALMTQATDY